MIPAPLFYASERCAKRATGRRIQAVQRSRIPDLIRQRTDDFPRDEGQGIKADPGGPLEAAAERSEDPSPLAFNTSGMIK